MFKKILLPVDLTDKHGRVLDVAVDIARQSEGEIVLLHVIEVIAGLSLKEETGFYNRIEKLAREHLLRLGAQLKDRGISWSVEVVYGNRGQEVVRFASHASVDLIVLTSPRLEAGNLDASWGSLSYKISLMCRCPVLLVK